MKKEDVLGLFVYFILLALAIVFGFTVLNTHSVNSEIAKSAGTWGYMGFMFGAIV